MLSKLFFFKSHVHCSLLFSPCFFCLGGKDEQNTIFYEQTSFSNRVEGKETPPTTIDNLWFFLSGHQIFLKRFEKGSSFWSPQILTATKTHLEKSSVPAPKNTQEPPTDPLVVKLFFWGPKMDLFFGDHWGSPFSFATAQTFHRKASESLVLNQGTRFEIGWKVALVRNLLLRIQEESWDGIYISFGKKTHAQTNLQQKYGKTQRHS